jgi:hypothetical protein
VYTDRCFEGDCYPVFRIQELATKAEKMLQIHGEIHGENIEMGL